LLWRFSSRPVTPLFFSADFVQVGFETSHILPHTILAFSIAHTLRTQTDSLFGIQNVLVGVSALVTGDDNAKHFAGSGSADTLIGAGGNDTLLGGAGNDNLVGGNGDDWASYGMPVARIEGVAGHMRVGREMASDVFAKIIDESNDIPLAPRRSLLTEKEGPRPPGGRGPVSKA